MVSFGLSGEFLSFLQRNKEEAVVLKGKQIELKRVIFHQSNELKEDFNFLGFKGVNLIKEDADGSYDVNGVFIWLTNLRRFASFDTDNEIGYIFEDLSWEQIENDLGAFINIQWCPENLNAIVFQVKNRGYEAEFFICSTEDSLDDKGKKSIPWRLNQYFEDKIQHLIENFEKTKTAKALNKSVDKSIYFLEKRDFINLLKENENYISLVLEHADLWKATIGKKMPSLHYETNFFEISQHMMKAYVVLQNKNGIDEIYLKAEKLKEILKNEYHMENTMYNFYCYVDRYINDIAVAKSMYDYITENPNCLQKKIYKSIGVNGVHSNYILDWAERHNIISRTRLNDTWLLKMN